MIKVKLGDHVRVRSGPAYVPNGRTITGVIEELTPTDDGDAEAMVRVTSGGLWGFRASHLTVLKTKG